MGWRFFLAAVALLALAGCGGSGNTRLPVACPTPGVLAEGADLTRYRPGPVRDLTTLEWDARIDRSGGCNPGRNNRSINMEIVARFQVERGVAAEGRQVELPWFVAVVDNRTEEILSRQTFVESLMFARNETRLTALSAPVSVILPVSETRRALDYRVYVSFDLSPEELALNRKRGPR